ncbi:suppressor of fused domain protein [Methylobrevis albus]|uniref:Suppressor of fused domain protein n=1 Tax=Methylobrevis albus TaxID=2793297 RepID=A0A931I3C1_9HYPH|nr:suppressor of fused domain protein [Methylobrevis albus]MBH0238669.1 suppressor of fused domain protein [Methylobrevis albus]
MSVAAAIRKGAVAAALTLLATCWSHAMDRSEKSPGGDRITRHADERDGLHAPSDAAVHLEEIETFLEGFLGPSAGVLHEIVSDEVHLDVIVFGPTADRDTWTFVTSGMSDRAMNVPDGLEPPEAYQYAELVITLPGDWFPRVGEGLPPDEAFAQPGKYWPIRVLKQLARLPHLYDSWIWLGHTFAEEGTPPEPYDPTTKLAGALLISPLGWPPDRTTLVTADGTQIEFMAVFPLYPDELDYKLNKGLKPLVDALSGAGVDDTVRPDRPSSIINKGLRGLLRKVLPWSS